MSATVATPREAGQGGAFGDVRMTLQQVRYEQLNFWRNRFAAAFTVGFSVVFLLLMAASGATQRLKAIDHVKGIQYYVAGFAAYGLMSACYSNLGIALVIRRETGLLKRLRLSPLTTWQLFGALVGNAAVVSVLQVALVVLIGRIGFHLVLPSNWVALLLAVVVGVVCFTALGVAASTFVPSQESAGPIVSLVFFILLFLSGLWFPLTPGSTLDQLSNWFPIHPMIVVFFAPFSTRPGASPWAWHYLLTVVIWGVVGAYVAVRRFRWEPRRR